MLRLKQKSSLLSLAWRDDDGGVRHQFRHGSWQVDLVTTAL
jgi:hypothetical protein